MVFSYASTPKSGRNLLETHSSFIIVSPPAVIEDNEEKYPQIEPQKELPSLNLGKLKNSPKAEKKENLSKKLEKYIVKPCLPSKSSKEDIKHVSTSIRIISLFCMTSLSFLIMCIMPGITTIFPPAPKILVLISIYLSFQILFYLISRTFKLGLYYPFIMLYSTMIIVALVQDVLEHRYPFYIYSLSMVLISPTLGLPHYHSFITVALYMIIVIWSYTTYIWNFNTIFARSGEFHPSFQFISSISSAMGALPGIWVTFTVQSEVNKEKMKLIRIVNDVEINAVKVSKLDLEEITFNEKTPEKLSRAFQKVVAGLSAFSKFVPVSVVKKLIKQSYTPSLGMKEQLVTVMFMDIENFTGLCENLKPSEMIQVTQDLLESASQKIIETGGLIDKYVGDAIMAFWGAPDAHEDQGSRSCRSAVGLMESLQKLHTHWSSQNLPLLNVRVGINQGMALVGNFGCSQRMEYTCIGDVVNVASRLEGANKVFGTRVLISHAVLKDDNDFDVFLVRPLGHIRVKGKGTSTQIYELIGIQGGFCDTIDNQNLLDNYRQAIFLLNSLKYPLALSKFRTHLQMRPNDYHAQLMISKLEDTKNTTLEAKDFHVVLDVK
eukprot:NODE_812_length_2338_cov_13.538149_g692_i0.p1 GENE.NODE_812_length_2338_cov_13.538149_g692_i0~~NODE_812_length_2338_cov_13.538149_g692_i0.p1  ORF type:complete len:605 (+),score=82.10 NODE_812_length_2338_cov_13.538149_g692_i0:3-1817(+)